MNFSQLIWNIVCEWTISFVNIGGKKKKTGGPLRQLHLRLSTSVAIHLGPSQSQWGKYTSENEWTWARAQRGRKLTCDDDGDGDDDDDMGGPCPRHSEGPHTAYPSGLFLYLLGCASLNCTDSWWPIHRLDTWHWHRLWFLMLTSSLTSLSLCCIAFHSNNLPIMHHSHQKVSPPRKNPLNVKIDFF